LPLQPVPFTFEEIEGTIQLKYFEMTRPHPKLSYFGNVRMHRRKKIVPRVILVFGSPQIDGGDLIRRIRDKVHNLSPHNTIHYYTWGPYWNHHPLYKFDPDKSDRAELRAQVFYSDFDTLLSYAEDRLVRSQPGKILLYGPSGCGKTWIILTIAKLLRLNLYDVPVGSEAFLNKSLFGSNQGTHIAYLYDNLDLNLIDAEATIDFFKQSCIVGSNLTFITTTDIKMIPAALTQPDRFKVYYVGFVDAPLYAQIIGTYFPHITSIDPLPSDHTIATVQIIKLAQEAAGDYDLFKAWMADTK
jgi:hypothetical protein